VGFLVRGEDIPELALDLDTPEDIRRFLALPGAAATPAGMLLDSFGVHSRLDVGGSVAER
jgi:hypothetical protein